MLFCLARATMGTLETPHRQPLDRELFENERFVDQGNRTDASVVEKFVQGDTRLSRPFKFHCSICVASRLSAPSGPLRLPAVEWRHRKLDLLVRRLSEALRGSPVGWAIFLVD